MATGDGMITVAVAGTGNLDLWVALVPTGSLLVAFVTAWAATYPQRKDRRERDAARKLREQRLDACADVVLGRDADPNTGQQRQQGLAETVNSHGRQLREVNQKIGTTKDGRSLAQVLDEALTGVARVGMAQQDNEDTLSAQQETIVSHGRTLDAHERRLGRGDERMNRYEGELRDLWRSNGKRPGGAPDGER